MVKLACPLCCGKYFDSRETLRIHLAASTEHVCCPECHQSFLSIADLINHLSGPCYDDSRNQLPCDPEEAPEVSEDVAVEDATIEEAQPIPGTDIVLTADGAANINVEHYIPIGFVAKEEPNIANEDEVGETEEDLQCYYCSSCECNIDSVIDHISMFHPNETIEYEGAELTMETDTAVVSDLVAETIIDSIIDESDPNLVQKNTHLNLDKRWTTGKQHSAQSEMLTNKIDLMERNLPRNAQELQNFLDGNEVLEEASPEEILFSPKREPRRYTEKQVEDEDGKISTVYTCCKCSREFSEVAKFKLHRCPVQGPRLKVCPVCEAGFKSPVDFIMHFREQHPNYKQEKPPARGMVSKMIKERESDELVSGFSCTRCSRDFFTETTWKLHKCKVPVHLHKECPICFKKYANKRNFTVHLQNHGLKQMVRCREDGKKSQVYKFMCVKCNRGFDSRLFFQLHKCVDVDVEKKVYECELCGSKMNTKIGLSSHMRMHKPEEEKRAWKLKQKAKLLREANPLTANVFVCPICSEHMSLKDKEIHVKMHQGEVFVCPLKSCNKNFARQELLDNHSQIHNEITPKIAFFCCYYCQQKFVDKDLFLEHTKKHSTPDRSYMCTHCGRGFQKPNERVKHEWVHTGNQPYVCLTCGMRFRKSFCLVSHERIHTGYRPYTCNTCGKTFRTRSSFTHHLRIHSDLRLFSCKFCPKTFKTAVQVANHRNSHTKPFTCSLCNRRFINSYSMRRHMKKHSSFEHFCDVCGAAYGRPFELRDHLIEAHGRPKSPSVVKRKSVRRKPVIIDEHSYDAMEDDSS